MFGQFCRWINRGAITVVTPIVVPEERLRVEGEREQALRLRRVLMMMSARQRDKAERLMKEVEHGD